MKIKFPCNSVDTCVVSMLSNDTLFYYIKTEETKKFIIGEYAYLHAFLKLDSSELDFYFLYEDSLKKVKGDNLPRLRALNEFERKKLIKKLKER
jgi:hypothetical protein